MLTVLQDVTSFLLKKYIQAYPQVYISRISFLETRLVISPFLSITIPKRRTKYN